MRLRDRVLLLVLGLSLSAAVARLVDVPGYMDAEYYFATGRELATGQGLQEPFLWNYLDEPRGLPHPSHAYWMPLPTFVAALGVALFGPTFSAGRSLFLVLASSLPLLTAEHAFRLTADRRWSWMSGLLALVPGYYSAYLVTTDSFAMYAVFGGTLLLLLASSRPGTWHWIGAGVAVGLCHLARADGLLWIPLAVGAAWTLGSGRARRLLLLTSGYAVVMGPWFLRNAIAFGTLLPPGQSRIFWMTNYNDLFIFPATALTPARWLASGWGEILGSRLSALASNLLSLWAINGLIFLLPLMVLGAWRYRDQRVVRLSILFLLTLLVLMSLVFPFAGARGGYFHSSIAAMPVLLALVPPGLVAFLEWGRRVRGWEIRTGFVVLGGAVLSLALGLTVFKLWERALGPDLKAPRWAQSARAYRRLADRIGDGTVAINNPPGFHLASDGPAVVIPSGGPQALLSIVGTYGVNWVILDQNRPPELAGLFTEPSSSGVLTFAFLWEDSEAGQFVVYRVVPP
ncbi:MAG: hypothetical protein WD906_05020 [Anaerolineales bacterium]